VFGVLCCDYRYLWLLIVISRNFLAFLTGFSGAGGLAIFPLRRGVIGTVAAFACCAHLSGGVAKYGRYLRILNVVCFNVFEFLSARLPPFFAFLAFRQLQERAKGGTGAQSRRDYMNRRPLC
jgi:hypothetical protein